ncbi:hypothetical protein CAI21_00520 [Alkalilimnicola ehrlichii]|uniref:Probable chorismate pyruvate-lyase n=1 Tax=Alkalilimnicola ehrlichii TaxID=351052 RepID=A0A3E0X1Q8_9GAMM|nr:chorismate lyase [Alkalilimnicola ehrlichii]RFA31174.1 hypothetical protein CAI21_00520 [Alkalilimnicola ehrlichii]RFA39541.1 hypothetical protein CAL65_01885 [Alkalilimnicola ehrlichii]
MSKWRPQKDPLRQCVPRRLRPWLEDTASLTARIQRHSGGRLRVRILSECWSLPAAEEALALGQPVGRYAWMREVLLMCDSTPWVYARTAVPLESLRGRYKPLLRLGARPLGSVLFGRFPVQRTPLLIRRLDERDPLLPVVQRHVAVSSGLWARRSMLSFDSCRLLVTEVFLPELVDGLRDKRAMSFAL